MRRKVTSAPTDCRLSDHQGTELANGSEYLSPVIDAACIFLQVCHHERGCTSLSLPPRSPPSISLTLSVCYTCIYVSVVWTMSERRTSAITVISDVRLSIVVAIKTRCITSRAYCSMFLVQYVNMPLPSTHTPPLDEHLCLHASP